MRYLVILATTVAWLNFNGTVNHLQPSHTRGSAISSVRLSNIKFSGDEIAVYSRTGAVIGWIKDAIVFNYEGDKALAFIDKQDVFSFAYGNAYLGQFHNGFFRDKTGNAVAWVRGASGGPITLPPLDRVAPIFMPAIKPITPIVITIIPIETLSWSNQSWDEFLGR